MTSPPIAEAPPSSEYSFPYAFPYVVERACEGDRDGCAYGEWLACGSIPVYASRDNTAEIVTTLEASDRFEVLTGNIVIESPGIVAVTRPSRPIPWEPGKDIFQPSDTLYVFHYRGEGFYTVWFKGEFLATEQFWPRSTTPSDPEFGGTLVQEVESVLNCSCTFLPDYGTYVDPKRARPRRCGGFGRPSRTKAPARQRGSSPLLESEWANGVGARSGPGRAASALRA